MPKKNKHTFVKAGKKKLRDHHSEKSKQYVGELKDRATKAELHFKNLLTQCKVEFVFQRAVKAPGSFWIIDFYIPLTKTCIEIDGGYHLEPEQKKKDEKRDTYLKAKGCQVIRITNEKVLAMTASDLFFKDWIGWNKQSQPVVSQKKKLKKIAIENLQGGSKKDQRGFKRGVFKKAHHRPVPTKKVVIVESQKEKEKRKLEEMQRLSMLRAKT